MIATLEDAWEWYKSAKILVDSMGRIGRNFWDLPEWHDALSRDNKFRSLSSAEIEALTQKVRADLDDLAVLVMFSVFEATVRERAIREVERELPSVSHPALIKAVGQLRETLNSGSFARVMDAYKSHDSATREDVDQVRKFRNWVAHGRRGEKKTAITPRAAFERLGLYLERIIPESDWPTDDVPDG